MDRTIPDGIHTQSAAHYPLGADLTPHEAGVARANISGAGAGRYELEALVLKRQS